MKELYENVQVEVVAFDAEDVIITSGDDNFEYSDED